MEQYMIELFSDSAEQLSNQTTQKSLSGKDKETLRDLARRELVESTSFYLKGVIERSLAAHEGQLDVDDIIDIINLEGKTALFMPASIFETAEELVHNYDMYFDMAMGRNKGDLKYSDRVRIAQAYLDQVENARQDGRYFGRNSLEYSAKYGSKSAASKAARKFLNQYGYELNDKAVEFSVSQRGRDPILEWGRVSQHIKPRATKDKTE